MVFVELSAGDGSFLVRAVERLALSCKRFGLPIIEARSSLIAYEVDEASAQRARMAVASVLRSAGTGPGDAEVLVDSWIRTGDYLTESRLNGKADSVVGNPPYIRLEDLEGGGALYRSLYSKMVARRIYVAFF